MAIANLSIGPGRHPLTERKDDLYETPACAVRALLALEDIPDVVWEPCCGPGAIVRVLRGTGRRVVASDLRDWGCPDSVSGVDFLMEVQPPDGAAAIVTNPPFKLAEECVAKALDLCPRVYLLMRLAFLEGLRWRRDGFDRHLRHVWVFAPRLPFMHRHGWGGPKQSSSAMPFAWYAFDRNYADGGGKPSLDWVNPRKYLLPGESK